jgi:hypothetical protein
MGLDRSQGNLISRTMVIAQGELGNRSGVIGCGETGVGRYTACIKHISFIKVSNRIP